MRQDFSGDPTRQVPNIPRPDFLKMKLLGQLTDDGFHEAAGSRQWLDDPRRTGFGHVRPQGGLQIDPHGRQFRLKTGA